MPPLDGWIQRIRAVRAAHQAGLDRLPDQESRWRKLCELNVAAQVAAICKTTIVTSAWARQHPLIIHGWIYDLDRGLLHDLDLSVQGESS